ncbi:MAG: 2-C-methyl-D-erythritol 4-phosphate cytidylyltransferase [Actinomycetota bacterium]|nr:2-C-methyl-D-erythritol 4-phosphate cytidylyltransferase [Actinomycetota bacterium]
MSGGAEAGLSVGGAVAVVLAAGSGDRLGHGTPKGFVTVGGRSILAVAAEAAAACPEVGSLVVAVPAGWEVQAAAEVPASKPVAVVAGGRSRHESVRLALAAVPVDTTAVLVHDAARCLASPGLFRAVLAALVDADGVVPVIAVPDTVKRIRDGRVVATESRDELGLAQTPQGFRAAALRDAHRRAEAEGLEFTDDAAAVEWAGYTVRAIPGERENFKITTPEDLARADALLSRADAGSSPSPPSPAATPEATGSIRTRG